MDTDELIKMVNRLQDAFTSIGIPNPVDLPQIVVIGSQSSGKSSVLENLVRRDFLPRGSGIVTRRPLILQLINTPSSNSKSKESSPSGSPNPDEWGEFLHLPGQKFHDFNAIREEIIADTDSKTGGTKGVSSLPINLRIYSPHVLTLTLVDLPGLTKVPVGDQPKDIEKQIREMIIKYITKSNALILAVTAANTDLANSDGLKLARDVDPDGIRTIGVLTKVDLMDKGTNCVDILAGKVIPLRNGFIPVVNRGQRDIETKKSILDALEYERNFFDTHEAYSTNANFCGTPFLAKRLNFLLFMHIKNCLPEIKTKISVNIQKYRSELAALGDLDLNQNTILALITEFCNDFRLILEGKSFEVSSAELNGGARVSFVFHELFFSAINGMDPFDQIRDNDIRTLLYNTSGSSPALFVAPSSFEILIKQQIRRLEEPSLKCVSMVFDELVRILNQILEKTSFKRFPVLKDRFYSAVTNFFRMRIEPTSKLVTSIVAAEACYINVCHPDFISGHKAVSQVHEKLYGPRSVSAAPAPQPAIDKKGATVTPAAPAPADPKAPGSSVLYAPSGSPSGSQDSEGFFSSFFNRQKIAKKGGVIDPMPTILKPSGQVSERELLEIEVIKLLLYSYFGIVKRTVTDLVPKSIMLNLVNYSKEELQQGLLAELYKSDLVDELLKESEVTIERRKECRKMLDAFKVAEDIVHSVELSK